MLRLLIDQDFNQDILRGLLHRSADMDAITAHQVGLSGADDPELLTWAAAEKRVLLTHDRRTMPHHAADRMVAGKAIAGVIVVSRRLPISRVIDELEIIVSCSDVDEWKNMVRHLPL